MESDAIWVIDSNSPATDRQLKWLEWVRCGQAFDLRKGFLHGIEFVRHRINANGSMRGLEVLTMTIEQVRQFYNAQPFRPFVLHLADGRQVQVVHREFIMAAPSGRTLSVYQPDDTLNVIDLLLVTDLEIKGTGRRKVR